MSHRRSKSFYDILMVPCFSSIEEIKISYRKLAKSYHPDISNDIDSELKMITLNEAYSILSDSKKKLEYDNQLMMNSKNKDIHLVYDLSLEEIYAKRVNLRYKVQTTEESISFELPNDIKPGHKMVFDGLGENMSNSEPGNLIIEFGLKKHPFFDCHHSGILTANYQVDVFDLLLGSEKTIMMIDGDYATIEIVKGSQPDSTIVIPGRGMIDSTGNRGHVLITLKVRLPVLTEDEEESIRKIRYRQKND